MVRCLSSGFAEIDNIISMFVLFSPAFGHFESLGFFSKNGGTILREKKSNRMITVNFEKYKY